MVPLVTSTELTIASVEFRASHPKLHHYTARSGLEGIVQSNSLWATRYRDLNDSAEIVHLKEPFASALAPRFDEIVERQKLNRQLRMLYEPLAKFIERGEFSLCSRGGAAGAQAGAGLSCVTRSI